MKVGIILFISAAYSFMQPQAYASGLDLTVGANFWQNAPAGNYGEASDALIDFTSDDSDFSEFYFSLEHSFPLLPNFRYSSYEITDSNTLTLDRTFLLAGQVYRVASPLQTTFQQEVTDYTLFFEMFDNQVLEFDLGVTFRNLNGSLSALNTDEISEQSVNSDEHTLTMLFGAAAVNFPLLYFTLGSEANFYDNNTYDVEFSVDVALNMVPMLEPYVTFGLKKHKSEINYASNLFVQQDWENAFIGIGVTF